ncbi:MAG: helix-turn-helix domain-containing protein [Frankiales bacterium]|nr:helix-turn-helix domain-containing protein [Frankiales bacterium]
MSHYRATEVAALLGVSDDTVRRWIDAGRLPAVRDAAGRWSVAGRDLAELARELASPAQVQGSVTTSATNRMPGLVTAVRRDGLVAEVEIQAGPFRLVSQMAASAADALGLEPGELVVASVTTGDLLVETTGRTARRG